MCHCNRGMWVRLLPSMSIGRRQQDLRYGFFLGTVEVYIVTRGHGKLRLSRRQNWWEWVNRWKFLRAEKLCEITASCISFYWHMFLCKSFKFNLNLKSGRQLKRPKKANTTHFSPRAFWWDHIYSDPSSGMSVKRCSLQGVRLGISNIANYNSSMIVLA